MRNARQKKGLVISLREKERMRELERLKKRARESKEVWQATRGEDKPKEQPNLRFCFDVKAPPEDRWDYLKTFETTLAYHADVVSPNVKFSYGVPRQTEDGKTETFTDPSPGCYTRRKLELLEYWKDSRRVAYEHNLMYKPLNFMPEFENIDFAKEERPSCGPLKAFLEKYEAQEMNEEEEIKKFNLNLAAMAVKHYNLTHELTHYVIEEVLGSKSKTVGITTWYHCNFLAMPKDGTGTECCSLFFAEVRGVDTTCCCILDGTLVRGCQFCGEEFAASLSGVYCWSCQTSQANQYLEAL